MLLFTSVAVGDLLVRYMSDSAQLAVSGFYRGSNADMIARLGLLFLPVVLTLLFGRKSLSRTKTVLHFVPIVATGGVLALLTLALMTPGFQGAVYATPFGPTIKEVQDLAIAAAGVASLLVAWITNGAEKTRHAKKH